MKKTQIIEAFRNIKKQKVSYISIVLITFLAVTAFLGVSFGSYSLAMGGSLFYDEHNFRDLEVISSVLFTDSDLEQIAAIEGIADVEGQMRTNAKIADNDTKTGVTVLSVTKRINIPLVKEGRMPEAADECAIETGTAKLFGLKTGDKIVLDESANGAKLLSRDEFTVTAIVNHPDHLVLPNTYTDYVIVPYESFNNELLQGRKIMAEVTVKKPAGINRLSKKYSKLLDPVKEKIEKLSVKCAEEALTAIWEELENYKAVFRDSYLKPALVSLIERFGNVEREEAENYVNTMGWAAPELIPNLRNADLDAQTLNILSDLSVKLSAAEEVMTMLKGWIRQLDDPVSVAGKTIIPALFTDEQIESVKEFMDSDVSNRFKSLLYVADMWNTGHARYLSTLNKLENVSSADDEIGVWVIMDPAMNIGFAHLSLSSGGISVLALRFTSLFILVGAIVIYATVGKLVDEQRKLVGATKAFGFFNREIFGKYMLFGGSATLLGSILGALAGIFLLQYFAVYSYSRYYLFDTPALRVIPWQLIIVPVAGMIITFLSIWLASSRLLRSPAIRLMQDTIPAGNHKSKGKKSSLSLYQRLILRNMRTDAKRVAVTIVSIAGCCALIVIGFSLYFSVKTTITKQFDQIIKHDSKISVDNAVDKDAAGNVKALLDSEQFPNLTVYSESSFIRIKGNLEPADYIVADPDEVGQFIDLRPKGKKWDEDYRTEGILLPGNYADTYRLKVGDTCTLIDSSGTSYRATISGVFDYYLGKMVILSPEAYKMIFGVEPSNNTVIVKHDASARDSLKEKLKSVKGFDDINRVDQMRTVNESYSDLLAIMVMILVGAAALMAAVILTNLVNIYILQKKRELTIMRVNGFTTKEVKNYVSREAFLTTLIGIILGVGGGLLMVQTIMPGLSKSYSHFDTTPNVWAILFSVVITIIFTVIIYHFALKKIKDLKLTDIA